MTEGAWFETDRLLIGGEWRLSEDGQTIAVMNPSDGTHLCSIARGTAGDIDAAVKAAHKARTGSWGKLTAAERGRLMQKLAAHILTRIDDLAYLEALDVGKPLKQARADVIAMARYFEFYGGAADKVMGDTIPFQDGYTVWTVREPHGVTGHIVPWNYPMQILARSVSAALAMGNAVVIKPAEEACLTSLAMARLAEEVGFPAGAINIITGYGYEAGAALTSHPGINHISFTGSVGVGIQVQQAAARNLVPVTLELGGKSPQIVFADADLDRALPFLVNGGIQNAGQTCSCAARLLVQKSRYDEIIEKLAIRYNSLKVGPSVRDLDLGPVISMRQKTQIENLLAQGTDLEIAGRGQIVSDAPDGGFYLAPTLFANVPPGHTLAQAEIFGPAQVVIPFEDEAHAVEIANGTEFGLVAGVWTENGSRALRLAKSIRAGQIFLNNYGAGGGVELPFGGYGKSGHGREKGFEALYGFSTVKTVAAHHG